MEKKSPTDVIPSPYERLFVKYDSFNAMQTALLDDLLHSNNSIVLRAPTGSGKTVAFELAIVRMLHQSANRMQEISAKAIYIAPIKALCNEIFENWKDRFNAIGINVSQLTGDTQSSNLMAIKTSQIVISTPEKWDSLTRRWRDFEELLPSVQLFIIDEVHLLNEDTRGPILEIIVSRMRSCGVKRFIVASATIPNVQDLAIWLSNCNVTVSQHIFNDQQRPVPLVKHILGVKTNLKGFQFDMRLNYQLPQTIRKFAEGKAVLIFCSCRKSAEMAAFTLNKLNPIFGLMNHYQKSNLCHLAENLSEPKLRNIVENGVAYHHAGLQYADRQLIESSFRNGFLNIMCCTSTLSLGINLPAHLVIIKSTETYMGGGGYVEYPENMLLQMIGRAGRPQYDTKGIAVILTQYEKIGKYKKLMNGKAPIESHLHKHLTEHLNSEIALGSISDLELAMDWIRSTYLYVRSVRNPMHYGFADDMSKSLIEHKLEELTLKQINELQQADLVKINNINGFKVQTTAIGKLMAKYYLSFETIKLFDMLQGNSTLKDIFELIAKCKELQEFTLRVNEKNLLNSMNKENIRFPIRGRIKSNEQKISCLMQAVLGNMEIKSPGLVQESLKIIRIAERVSKCLLEFVRLRVQKNFYSKAENQYYKAVLNSFIAAKCIHVKLWENSEYASKQLHGIGNVYSTLLHNAGKTTLKSISDTDAATIENILKKAPPFGDEILKNLILFPEYEIKLSRKSNDCIQIYAKQLKKCYKHKPGSIGALIVGDSFNNLLLLAENLDSISATDNGQLERTVQIKNPQDVEYIYAHIVHTCFVGVDVHETLEINAPKVESSTKRTKKPKKQTRLKKICNETIHDLDFLAEKSLDEDKDEETKTDDDNRMTISKLKEFEFKKSKLSHHEKDDASKCKKETDSDESLLKVAKIKPLNETNFMDKTNDITMNTNRTIQSKLTDFFSQTKKSNVKFTATKPLIIDLRNEEVVEKSFYSNSAQTSTVRNVTENVTDYKNTMNATHQQTKSLCDQNFAEKVNPPYDQNMAIVPQSHYPNASCEIIEFPKEPEPMENLQTSVDNCENSSRLKRTSTDSFSNTSFKFPVKKPRQQLNIVRETAPKSCPLSLESFLGIGGNVERTQILSTLSNKENIPIEMKNEQSLTEFFQGNKKYPINISKPANYEKPFHSTSMQHQNQNRQSITTSLELDKKFADSNPHMTDRFSIKGSSIQSISSDTSLDHNMNPSDAEFELWYKVALKFQRLPTQALSLKNFRYVFNKIMIKEKQANLSSKRNGKNHQISKSKRNIFSVDDSLAPSSSSNLFRLQLFPNDENPTENTMQRSTIDLINQSVMKLVMAMKFAELDFIEKIDIDKDLELALSDLEKENLFPFTHASNGQINDIEKDQPN